MCVCHLTGGTEQRITGTIPTDCRYCYLRFVVRIVRNNHLTAYFDMTSIIWEMGTPSDGYEWIPVTIYSSALDQYPGLSDLQIKSNLSTRIQQNFFAHSDQIPVWSSICWRGGFSIFVLLVCSFLLIKKKRSQELLALIPALLLTGILFLATPSQDPRYIDSYHMLASFFILVAAFSEEDSNNG